MADSVRPTSRPRPKISADASLLVQNVRPNPSTAKKEYKGYGGRTFDCFHLLFTAVKTVVFCVNNVANHSCFISNSSHCHRVGLRMTNLIDRPADSPTVQSIIHLNKFTDTLTRSQ